MPRRIRRYIVALIALLMLVSAINVVDKKLLALWATLCVLISIGTLVWSRVTWVTAFVGKFLKLTVQILEMQRDRRVENSDALRSLCPLPYRSLLVRSPK